MFTINVGNFFKRLPSQRYPMPKTYSEIPNYKDAFNQAIKFTHQLGYPAATAEWKNKDFLSTDGNFLNIVMGAAGITDPTKAAAQCLKWSHWLAPYYGKQFNCKSWVTIGQIWKDNAPVYSPTWDDLTRWGKQGMQLQDVNGKMGMNFHAWITLESGEIIDPSYLSTLAKFIKGFEEYNGATVWGRDPHVLNNHRYFPMAIGSEYAESVSSKSCAPLLAQDIKELHSYIEVLVPNTI